MTDEWSEDQEDLFEMEASLPEEVAVIVTKYLSELEDPPSNSYAILKEFLKEVEQYSYTFEYGLDAVPYGLRKLNFGVENE